MRGQAAHSASHILAARTGWFIVGFRLRAGPPGQVSAPHYFGEELLILPAAFPGRVTLRDALLQHSAHMAGRRHRRGRTHRPAPWHACNWNGDGTHRPDSRTARSAASRNVPPQDPTRSRSGNGLQSWCGTDATARAPVLAARPVLPELDTDEYYPACTRHTRR